MAAGFYGKMPSKGDFVQRNLHPGVSGAWDAWLQACVESSKAALGQNWLNAYLVSPLWRFAISPNLFSPNAFTGVMMPSVDSVGRYFPLMLGAELPAQTPLLALATEAEYWYQAAEDLLLTSLQAEFDFSSFEHSINALQLEMKDRQFRTLATQEGRIGWRADSHSGDALLSAGIVDFYSQAVLDKFSGFSLWWSCGADNYAPVSLLYPGLPPAQDYQHFLVGDWTDG